MVQTYGHLHRKLDAFDRLKREIEVLREETQKEAIKSSSGSHISNQEMFIQLHAGKEANYGKK